MSKGIESDPTDQGNILPKCSSDLGEGGLLILMEWPDFDLQITLPIDASPDDPTTLLMLYYTTEIINGIVQHTNNLPREAREPTRPHARALPAMRGCACF